MTGRSPFAPQKGLDLFQVRPFLLANGECPCFRVIRRLLLAAATLLASLAATAGSTVQTEQVRAELIAHAPDGLSPGKTVWFELSTLGAKVG